MTVGNTSWLSALRLYLLFTAGANLVWEFAHMPLYTLWREGSVGEIVFAAVHCTGGDVLVALGALTLALVLAADRRWPAVGAGRIVALSLLFGLAYTLFSEWLNIEVREAWAYSELMPVVPFLGAGLSPVLQWIVVPLTAFAFALRVRREKGALDAATSSAA